MRKNALLLPISALALGFAGGVLRRRELNTVFDPVTGLAERGAAVTVMLCTLVIAALVLYLVVSYLIGRKYTAHKSYDLALFAGKTPALAALTCAGFLWLAASVKIFLDARVGGGVTNVDIVFCGFSALSAISVIALALLTFKSSKGPGTLFFSVVPSLFLCLWLILFYKQNATNSVRLDYCYQCLAIASAVLSFYFSAGCFFGKAAAGKTIYSYMITIFFGTLTLFDSFSIEMKSIFAAILIITIVYSVHYIGNAIPREAVPPKED